MKIYIIAIALICCSYSSIAQSSKIDSLKNQLTLAKSVTDSANLVRDIAIYYIKDTTQFNNYTRIYTRLSNKINDPYIKGTSYKLNSNVFKKRRWYDSSSLQSELAIKEFAKIKDTAEINKNLYALFQSYFKQKRPDKAIEAYKNYLSFFTPKWEFEYHYQFARYYLNEKEFDKSIHSLETALAMNNVLKDNQLLGKAHYKLGQIFLELRNYDDAISNLELALGTLTPSKNTTIYGGGIFCSWRCILQKKRTSRSYSLFRFSYLLSKN